MEVLTPLHKKFIHKFSISPFQKSFFLTGGTALAAFYLHHRLSEDLDFFTELPEEVRALFPWIQTAAQELGLRLEIRRQAQSFIGCFLEAPDGELLRVDFAQDSPFRFEKTILNSELNIYVDNLTDIACNKLSALFDRAESKDFVDLYFLHQEFLPFSEILSKAKQKHVGLDDYWLAQALRRIEEIKFLPRLLKPVSLDTLKVFFSEQAKKLIEG